MKYLATIFTLVIITLSAAQAQTRLYENPEFDAIASDHEIIAVVPFNTTVTLRPKQMKDITPEQLARMEKAEGEGIMNAMHAWFLNRKKNNRLTVDVQAPVRTMALLSEQGLEYDNLYTKTPMELARILGVDAVIMGTFETNKPMSEGASVVLGALLGFWGPTNNAVINLTIYNAADEEILVNYHKGLSGSIGSSTEQLVNVLMRKASRRISYTK